MITLKSDSDLQTLLDQPSFDAIVELMMKDSTEYSEKFRTKVGEWVPRLILGTGSNHTGSTIPYGFSLLYQFRLLPLFFDVGIREIRMAESTDDFLDLYNEMQKDPTIINKEKGGIKRALSG